MKKILLIAIFIVTAITVNAQFQNFFKPVPKDLFEEVETIDRDVTVDASTVWLFRPVVSISAMQINLGSASSVSSLTSLGTGVSYAYFVNNEGGPYMKYAFNLLVLFGTEIADVTPLQLSLAGTATLWEHVSFGAGYNFSDDKIFLLTGIVMNFN
jgi:hypothetical protein